MKIAVVLVMLVMGGVGCVTPSARHVQAIDSSESTVKFLYTQYVVDRYERGMIECDLEGDELTNCRELEVDYR